MGVRAPRKQSAAQALDTLCEGRKRAPSLKTLATFINTHAPDLTAEVTKSWSSTDRKLAGTRLRIPGQGRKGNKLTVRNSKRVIVLEHDASETYRFNGEALLGVAKLISHPNPYTLYQRFTPW